MFFCWVIILVHDVYFGWQGLAAGVGHCQWLMNSICVRISGSSWQEMVLNGRLYPLAKEVCNRQLQIAELHHQETWTWPKLCLFPNGPSGKSEILLKDQQTGLFLFYLSLPFPFKNSFDALLGEGKGTFCVLKSLTDCHLLDISHFPLTKLVSGEMAVHGRAAEAWLLFPITYWICSLKSISLFP